MSEQPAARLTAQTLRDAMEKVRDAPLRVCGVTEPHVVHPEAKGWTNCANCFGAVFVAYDHEPCCTSCKGKGADASGPCWDCRGTGHAHP